ncbi:MAG: hypothetical protein Q8L08_01030 [Candidatus Nanopelagicaceae bacterium]|nr:hypothetical protein [Candidatus Nanopelagicaceae bacterium]
MAKQRFQFLFLITVMYSTVLFFQSSPAVSAESRMDSSRITIYPTVFVDNKTSTVVPLGKAYSVKYQVDNVGITGPVQVVLKLYSDGSLVWTQTTPTVTKDGTFTRKIPAPLFVITTTKFGPFYLCFSTVNSAGAKSSGAPCSNVMWVGIEVPLNRVSNGCGGQLGSKFIDRWMSKEWDSKKIGGETVVFKPACDAHDAGYSGLTVKNPISGIITDYRTWTRQQVDDFFMMDLQSICMKHPKVVMSCMSFPTKYYGVVRTIGSWFYDADPTIPGITWNYKEVPNRTTAPRNVERDNT